MSLYARSASQRLRDRVERWYATHLVRRPSEEFLAWLVDDVKRAIENAEGHGRKTEQSSMFGEFAGHDLRGR